MASATGEAAFSARIVRVALVSLSLLSVGVIISTPAPSNDTKRADEMIATMTIDRAFETGIT